MFSQYTPTARRRLTLLGEQGRGERQQRHGTAERVIAEGSKSLEALAAEMLYGSLMPT